MKILTTLILLLLWDKPAAHALALEGSICRFTSHVFSCDSVKTVPDDRLKPALLPLRSAYVEYGLVAQECSGILREGSVAMLVPSRLDAKIIDSFSGDIDGLRILWIVCREDNKLVVGILIAETIPVSLDQQLGVFVSIVSANKKIPQQPFMELANLEIWNASQKKWIRLGDIGSVVKTIESVLQGK